jgi:hypothetical protein
MLPTGRQSSLLVVLTIAFSLLAFDAYPQCTPSSCILGGQLTCCSASCTSNVALRQNIDCSGATGIALSSGADLDLNGFNITCSSSCPGSAVTINGSNSVVKNTLSGLESEISGGFSKAVNCNGKNGSEVTGIRLQLTDDTINNAYGAYGCSKVDNNVLIGNGNFFSVGIYDTGVSNNDFVKNNYLDEWGAAIQTNGSTANTVSQNIVVLRPDLGGLGSTGLYAFGSGAFLWEANSLLGDPGAHGQYLSPDVDTTLRNNFCDPSVTACASCSNCSTPIAPVLQ